MTNTVDRIDNLDNRNDHDSHDDCNDHDSHEVQNQHHLSALRNIDRMVDGTMKSWLILDNADNYVDIEMKRLSWISKDLDMVDPTSNMDMITKIIENVVLDGSTPLPNKLMT